MKEGVGFKVVAVTQRVEECPERKERRDALDQRLVVWLTEAGYWPVPVPNGLVAAGGPSALVAWCDRIGVDAVVLSGGPDIGQAPERDATGRGLLDLASDRRWALLGLCNGMQMMAVWAGARLRAVEGHVRTRHALKGDIVGPANSYHGQSLATCPEPFDILAISEDGAIEAIGRPDLPWEGWMWHPEREDDFDPRDTSRLKRLFGAA